ncbi:MAG TPA: hypothetical protein VK602_09825 [Phyllobacterium sp.]|nr:hypothetical protein [Phyllobacterium sp.]
MANLLPGVFALDVGGKPVLTFEAKNLREAHELCHEEWLRADFARLTSNGVPLWDGEAHLRARYASDPEKMFYLEAAKGTEPPLDELVLAYLVELDAETV